MTLLLDTHAFLWFIEGSARLSLRARDLIEGDDEKLLSVAGLWEMAIKVSLGKLELAEPFETLIPGALRENGFGVLNIGLRHLFELTALPYHHGDPFDRLLIAQSRVEGFPTVSRDASFDAYGVDRFW